MCVVSEELSRGYIGVGSLGTRSEIAAELILCGGTEAQKKNGCRRSPRARSCPRPSSPSPTPAPTSEPARPARKKDGDDYTITGNKTWITHPPRADVMTVLARTNPDETGYKGLSMFLAEKTRGTDETPSRPTACPAARSRCSAIAA
jgi:(2S)-methylsuccinyl-CoA dehydrogenase